MVRKEKVLPVVGKVINDLSKEEKKMNKFVFKELDGCIWFGVRGDKK